MSSLDKCTKCNAHCCRHVAVGINTPKSKRDFDNIRWYLLHKNVWVSIDLEGNWLLEFRTPCRHIKGNYECSIYEKRPDICRDYPAKDELCEGETDEPSYSELFKCAEDLQKFLSKIKIAKRALKK